ncbi:MAG: hypothetical protein ACRYGK_02100 [Janthinobacterium lividum]
MVRRTHSLYPAAFAAIAATCLAVSGCSSILAETSSAGAGIAGTALANAVSDNANVVTGIGLGVQAGTRAVVQYGQRRVHMETQQQIASTAGSLQVGQVAAWKVLHDIALEPDDSGRVTVSRTISTGELECKEIVFSVDRTTKAGPMDNRFYVASICRNGEQWAWASAEPATARWGSLQ